VETQKQIKRTKEIVQILKKGRYKPPEADREIPQKRESAYRLPR
jgi:hypothetical protein